MKLALLLPLLALMGCNEPRLLNPGAETAYWEVPQSELDADHPRHMEFIGGGSVAMFDCMALGDCLRDGTRIRVAFKQDEWEHQHEASHLLDNIATLHPDLDAQGVLQRARMQLGQGIPDAVTVYLDTCQAWLSTRTPDRIHPRWSWRVLQAMYPRDSVIQHQDIIAELRRQDGVQ
jgi:hypothetical protein